MIKKSLLIGSALLLLAVLAAPDAQALSPIRFGVKAGIQTQSLKMQGMNWNELSKSNNFGYQLGVMAQVPLGPVYLQPEIFYSSARFKLQGDLLNPDGTMAESDVSAKYSVNTVQLPVLVGIKLLFLRVFAGPSFNLLTDTSNKSGKEGVSFNSSVTKSAVAFQVGAGVEIGKFNIDIRYDGPIQETGADFYLRQKLHRDGQNQNEQLAAQLGLLLLTGAPPRLHDEKVILLEGVDPVELYGAGNSNIEKISAKFPKLKIIARGSSVKVMGEASEIGRFEQKLTDLIDYYGRYGHLSGEVIDQVYDGGMPKRDETADKDAIVFGNNGVIVRARTVNQQKLVQLYEHNDLLFAVGPAGSGKTYTAIALAVPRIEKQRGQAHYPHPAGRGSG